AVAVLLVLIYLPASLRQSAPGAAAPPSAVPTASTAASVQTSAGQTSTKAATGSSAGQTSASPPSAASTTTQTAASVTSSVVPTQTSAVRTSTGPPARPPPFNASYFEANYTLTMNVAMGSVSLRLWGWLLQGVGPLGNYSVLNLTAVLPGRGPVSASYTAVARGNLTYIVACSGGRCVGRTAPVNKTELSLFSGLFSGAMQASGNCTYLNYTGVELRGSGNMSAGSIPGLAGLPNGTGNYTAEICEAYGVPLSASVNLRMGLGLYNETVVIDMSLKLSAVRVGPYSPERYRQLLEEAEAAVAKSSGGY
ncbi:MAG: hypothetical protein ACP5MH_11735, partial [Thermoproteus sp.]